MVVPEARWKPENRQAMDQCSFKLAQISFGDLGTGTVMCRPAQQVLSVLPGACPEWLSTRRVQ